LRKVIRMKSLNLLVIDDSQVLNELFKKAINADIHLINIDTKDRDIIKILNEIKEKTENNNIQAIFINAHLTFNEHSYRHQCGGIELLKHIRLTKELRTACLLPIILGTFLPVEYYIRKSPDNVIILSPGCRLLPVPSCLFHLPLQIELPKGFKSFESMKEAIKDFIITDREKRISKHGYQNIVGVHRFIHDFCKEIPIDSSYLKNYQRFYMKELWFKKMLFKDFFGVKTGYISSKSSNLNEKFQEISSSKKFVFIDDKHYLGWSWGLYSGLFAEPGPPELFSKGKSLIEVNGGNFIVIAEYKKAEEFFSQHKHDFQNILDRWYEKEKEYKRVKQNYNSNFPKLQNEITNLESKLIELSKQQSVLKPKIIDLEEKLRQKEELYKEKYLELAGELEEKLGSLPETYDDFKQNIETYIDCFKKAAEDTYHTKKAYQENKHALNECEQNLNKASQELQEKRSLLRNLQEEYDQIKKELIDVRFQLSKVIPYDMIFLDLRLEPAADEEAPIEQITGIRLLENIKQIDPSIPVVIFTASEKALVYKKVLQNGADEYWIKEVSDPLELKSIIINCLRKYKNRRLREIHLRITQIEKIDQIKGLKTGIQDGRPLEPDELSDEEKAYVLDLLKEGFFILRKESSDEEILSGDILERIISKLARVQEIRYQVIDAKKPDEYGRAYIQIFNNERKMPESIKKFTDFKTEQKIRELRKQIAHASEEGRRIELKENYIADLMDYTVNWILKCSV